MATRLQQLFRSQSFTFALIAAVVAALIAPELGTKGGPLRPELTTKMAVALTFVIQGLSLPTRQIAASSAKVRLHVFCQLIIFLGAPALMLAYLLVIGEWIHHPSIRSGFFYLSALPTTISSAIVMTSNSNGDSSAALFSTTLSNVLGIFITPLLCAYFIASSPEAAPSLGALIGKLSLLVLLPLVVGQVLRAFIRDWANRSLKLFKRLSNAFIVFIVFAAFCQSADSGVWSEAGAGTVVVSLLFTLVFLLLFSALVWLAAPIASRNTQERIALFFCGSQKTLATGVPMASILFASAAREGTLSLGLIILPLMCYHPLQLFLAGFLSPYLNPRR